MSIQEQFEQYGKVERVKKIKDYAFVHFEDRDNAVLAMRGLDGKDLCGSQMEVRIRVIDFKGNFLIKLPLQVSLAKPPSDKKKKEEILRARERRMMQMMQTRSGIIGYVIVDKIIFLLKNVLKIFLFYRCDAFSMSPTGMMPPPIPPMAAAAGMRTGASNQPRLPLRGPMAARDYGKYFY